MGNVKSRKYWSLRTTDDSLTLLAIGGMLGLDSSGFTDLRRGRRVGAGHDNELCEDGKKVSNLGDTHAHGLFRRRYYRQEQGR